MDGKNEERPLEGKRVAVTRAREQSDGLVERLSGLGAQVVECPAISIAPVQHFSAMDSAIARLEGYDWVIFTSVNGVEAFARRMDELGIGTKALCSRKLGAIGPATAAELEKFGCAADFVPDTYVAEAVVEQIGDVSGCRVLLPRADIARKALAEGLRAKGAHVDELVAYRTVPGQGSARLAALLRQGTLDAVTFTSSSTIRYTLENLDHAGLRGHEATAALNQAKIVCIGPITAGTAEGCGLRVARVAEEFTVEGLISALVKSLGSTSPKMEAENAGSE